jgi:hypothetical protein
MMTMTRKEAFKKIEKFAKAYRIRLEIGCLGSWTAQANDEGDKQYLQINIMPEPKIDAKRHLMSHLVKASASICSMGGNPGTYELQAAADEIDRGASFVAALNNLEIEIIDHPEEEIA